jgi:predicted SAM-dependent methyltransferase
MGRRTKQKIYRIPVVGYVIHLVEAFFRLPRNDTRIQELREAARAESGKGSLGQHLPALLNALETVPALAREIARVRREVNSLRAETSAATEAQLQDLQQEVGRVWERLEFVRLEIMYEMNHGPRGTGVPDGPHRPVAEVLEPEKVARQMRELGGVRLNLGCGHVPLEGCINVDMRALPGVDVVADVADLPFQAGEALEIRSAHLLEHFPQERLVRTLLPAWFKALRAGGEFRAIVPDGAAMIAAAAAGTSDYEDFRTVLFGAQEYAGDFHFNLLTPDTLGSMLREAGFVDIATIEAGRRNGRWFEFEIRARKPIS